MRGPSDAHPGAQRRRGLARLGGAGAGQAREPFELELIGREDVRAWHRTIGEESRDAGADIEAAVVAHDRVAAPQRGGIVRAQLADGGQHGAADLGVAEVAAEQGVAPGQRPMGGKALDQRGDFGRRQGAARVGAVAGVVAELDGVDGQRFGAEALEGKDRRGIADMPRGHPGLDGEYLQGELEGDRGARQAAVKAAMARARWLVACFSAASISP